MEIEKIKRLVDLMKSSGLTEFTMKDDKIELVLKRGSGDPQVACGAPPPTPASAPPPPETAETAVVPNDTEGLIEISSPVVGTFYQRPAADKPNYVNEGDDVREETVVCIVEAMKVMNEIKAEVKGTIVKILVEDASPVQYGQPLFLVDAK